jgi:cyclopropane fatty-acyl-phospholipid synthase-like methyltransferase
MLDMASITDNDRVYDLGCGDGRIPIAAASLYGARGVGIDIEPYWVDESRLSAKAAGVAEFVQFEAGDAMSVDLSPATVITLYLVDWSTQKMLSIIKSQVRAGTRIISHNFTTDDWEPARVESFTDAEGVCHTLYLWIT